MDGCNSEKVPVVKGNITGLPIPADAEIALEGYIYPDDLVPEGPFGEFTGYYAGGRNNHTCIIVKAVYYRNDPIILASPLGTPLTITHISEASCALQT